jgi:hypothetical protein
MRFPLNLRCRANHWSVSTYVIAVAIRLQVDGADPRVYQAREVLVPGKNGDRPRLGWPSLRIAYLTLYTTAISYVLNIILATRANPRFGQRNNTNAARPRFGGGYFFYP